MKKLCLFLLSIVLLVSCTDGKRIAPKEGRIALTPEINLTPTKHKINLASTYAPTQWSMVFRNAQNSMGNISMQSTDSVKWTTDIGKNYTESNIPQTPIVAKDTALFALSGDFTLSKINLQDGTIIWQKQLLESKKNSVGLVLGNDTVFATSDAGDIVAVNFNGDILWHKELNIPVSTTPTLNNNMLFVVSPKNILSALRQKNGTEVWRYQTASSGTFMRGMAHPTIYNDILIVPFTTGEVIGFDATSGLMEWVQMMIGKQPEDLYELPHILASPVVDKQTVYLAGNANLLGAYDVRSGTTKWAHNIGTLITPIVSGNTIFIITKAHHLLALERVTGHVFWDTEMPHEKSTSWTSLRLINNQLYVSDTEATYIVAPENGQLTSKTKKHDFITDPIIIDDAMIGVTHRAKVKLYRK